MTQRTVTRGALLLALLGAAVSVWADPPTVKTYDLHAWVSTTPTATLWVVGDKEGPYTVTRQPADATQPTLTGVGELKGGFLRVEFRQRTGAAGALANLGSTEEQPVVARGIYKATKTRAFGTFIDDRSQTRTRERGGRGADRPLPGEDGAGVGDDDLTDGDGAGDTGDEDGAVVDDGLRILKPAPGGYLIGDTAPVELSPLAATLSIEGSGEQTEDGVAITGTSTVTLIARHDGQASEPVELQPVTPRVRAITVLDTVAIADARPPHFAAQPQAEPRVEPAAIYAGKLLRLEVQFETDVPLVHPTEVKVEASGRDVTLSGSGTIGGGGGDSLAVIVETKTPLNDGVDVNDLKLSWTVAGQALDGTTALRVYTTYKAPIKNIGRDVNPPNTKRHFDNACRWANGASQNIGEGSDSIPYQVDNYMVHYVHWKQLGSDANPLVPDYPRGAEPPLNYADIYGWVSNGHRRPSSLYYPPLEPDEDYEQYTHFASNFGWWVLDNPTHTGGRCNQQASLVAGVLGTLGIKAQIHYLARWGRAKMTRRPVRMYFYSNDGSATGGGPWNFHGVCMVDMADGSQHIYDGSFSSPPHRKHGSREWAEGNDGPFVKKWTDIWVYDDARTPEGHLIRVPDYDIPTTWNGVQ